ncbi:MAG: hypothetical protein ACPG8W_17845 [Candidatus Promineifilaceae bacterium]
MSSLFDKVRTLFRSKMTRTKPQAPTIPQDWINRAQEEVGTRYSRADLANARKAETGASTNANTVELRQKMLNQFSLDDLNAAADIMGIDTAKLEGGKGRRVMALITLSEKSGRLEELIAICKAMKPDATW